MLFFCGADRFSGSQIKFVFKDLARGLDGTNQATLQGAYIPIRDFKERFYPGRSWEPQFDAQSEERRRLEAMANDDASSATSKSVAVSTIMQGKTNADLYNAREMEERKQLMRDKIRQNELDAERGSLLDDFEQYSEAS